MSCSQLADRISNMKEISTEKNNILLIKKKLNSGTYSQIKRMLNKLHPSDIAHFIESSSPTDREFVWQILNKKTEGEVLFAVSNEHFSVAEIAKLTVEHIGSGRVAFINWPRGRKNIDIGDAVISNKKIKDLLDWSPKFSIKTGLDLTKDYYQSCLDKYFS